MSQLAVIANEQTLVALVKGAASALASATSYAEVLEAKEKAGVAYDMAKRASRLAKVKEAHDRLIETARRAQADALKIEAEAKRRVADEYDAAQQRGEVARLGSNQHKEGVPNGNTLPDAADIGLSRKDIHEARQIRNAEKASPGIVEKTVDDLVARGEEPTRAAVKRAVEDVVKPPEEVKVVSLSIVRKERTDLLNASIKKAERAAESHEEGEEEPPADQKRVACGAVVGCIEIIATARPDVRDVVAYISGGPTMFNLTTKHLDETIEWCNKLRKEIGRVLDARKQPKG